VSITRQSSRYKDDLQTTRTSSTNISKQKLKKRYKVEIPDYPYAKIDTINRLIAEWKSEKNYDVHNDPASESETR
jgi:hypothetical protein